MATTALSALVSADEVRALLGVSVKELRDETLALPLYWKTLKAEFNALSPTLLDDYDALPGSGLTKAQERFKDAVETFAGMSAAVLVAVALPQFSPRTISDGKAMMQRQLDSPAQTMLELRERLALARAELDSALKALTSTAATVFVFPFRASSPASDPVTD